jgi:CDP-diacylglycerol--glycerol-3-phosphate 3-phosphatidyltransferase
MSLPNTITFARIALVPVFVVLAYIEGAAAAIGAFAVFVTASLSDSLDGYLARRHGTESRLGKFLDPLADKLLVGAALIVLVDDRSFPLWAAILIAIREIAVQILRTNIVRRGGDLPASPSAKAKTVLQILMVGWWLLPIEVGLVHWALLVVALGATLWSGVEYFRASRSKEAVT